MDGGYVFTPVCLFVCLSVCVSIISQKVMDRFGGNLVDRLGVRQERMDSILVKIQIREFKNFKSDSSPLKDDAKNDIIALFFKRLWTSYNKTCWMSG